MLRGLGRGPDPNAMDCTHEKSFNHHTNFHVRVNVNKDSQVSCRTPPQQMATGEIFFRVNGPVVLPWEGALFVVANAKGRFVAGTPDVSRLSLLMEFLKYSLPCPSLISLFAIRIQVGC